MSEENGKSNMLKYSHKGRPVYEFDRETGTLGLSMCRSDIEYFLIKHPMPMAKLTLPIPNMNPAFENVKSIEGLSSPDGRYSFKFYRLFSG
ncbi:hypothetical protein HY449_00890 [Candidatus Pacearchaeota archaeon]|nr:hypothetical protein [Candidatus Pacearchaeota archaeon]